MSLRRLTTVSLCIALVVGALTLVALPSPAAPGTGTYPAGFTDEIAVSGLNFPMAIDFTADGRMFIAEKEGVIRVVQNGVLLPTPFIDISGDVDSAYEFGLLDMTLDPNFPTAPYVYVRYVYDPPGVIPDVVAPRVQRVERITANALNTNVAATGAGARVVLAGKNGAITPLVNPNDLVPPNGDPITCVHSGVIVPDCIPADTASHAGGSLKFGPDGSLFTSIGDTDRLPAGPQTVGTWTGTILRINPATGQGYANNPYYDGNLDSNASKVWAYGFRNPFRIAIHPTTGELIAGDVGQDTWEELDLITPGANYGWPCREGPGPYGLYASEPLCANALSFVDPIAAYQHDCCGGSVVAGDWYRGTVYPVQYRGAFFFGDYSEQIIRYLKPNNVGGYDVTDFATGVGQDALVAIRYAPDGYLYWVDLLGGQIHRIGYPGVGHVPPTAVATASTLTGVAPLTVTFSASGSIDPDGQPLTYHWDFGDGTTSAAVNPPPHTYTVTGNYTVTLTVTDSTLLSSTQTLIVRVNTAPILTIVTPANNSLADVGSIVAYSGTATDATDGDISAQIEWTASIRHNVHVHPNVFTAIGATGSFTLDDHGDDMHVELCASVTNTGAQTSHACVNVYPTTVNVNITSVPPGQVLTINGISRPTPFSMLVNRGATRTLAAPLSDGGCLSFEGWSDGGAAVHDVVVAAPATYTATYACTAGPASVVGLAPHRLLDTRPLSSEAYVGDKPAAGQVVEVRVAGTTGVPADASAVLLTITGTEATEAGFVTAWPCGQPRPNTSVLNLVAAGTDADSALINVGIGGEVCLYTERGTHLIVDLAGFVPATADLAALTPTRVLETRPLIQVGYNGDKPAPGQTVALDLSGVVPANTSAVWLNVTATDATNAGYVTVWPCGQSRPNASNLNLVAGGTDANLVDVKLGSGATVCLFTEAGTHLIADLVGLSPTGGHITVMTPVRRLETRPGIQIGYQGIKPVAGQTIELVVAGVAGVPVNATAVLLNLTGTDATNPGFVTVWPCGQPRPNASHLNLTAGGTDADFVFAPIGTGGKICIYTEAGTHLIADVEGYSNW